MGYVGDELARPSRQRIIDDVRSIGIGDILVL